MPVTLFIPYLIAFVVASNTTGQQCKPSEVSIPGKALNDHTFKATVISGPIQCQILCENDPKCRSYNFHILTKNCELNDETKETKPSDLVTDDQRLYMKREDIDECKVFPFTCDVNADCHNTDSSYICTCNAGYTGDGKTCTDIDECSTGKHNCSHVAVCNNTIGSYNCSCKEGYVGDGRKCSGCPKDWVVNDKYCYKLLAAQPKKLEDARKRCLEMLADLPIIKSEQENNFIASLLSAKTNRARLGMKRDPKGKFLWFDFTTAETSYNAWGANEPTDKKCAFISIYYSAPKWYANKCNYRDHEKPPFLLCQKPRF